MIYTSKYSTELLEQLKALSKEEDYIKQLECNKLEACDQIICRIQDSKEKCDESMAHVLSDLLQREAIYKVCKAYLKEREDLSIDEKREAIEIFKVNHYLSRQDGSSYVTYYLVYVPILQELQENNGLHIEGWLNFRMQKYKILLQDLLEQFISDYTMKKEIVGFLKMMREVNILSLSLEDVLHLSYSPEGKVLLLNKNMKNVTALYIKRYCRELLVDSTLSREDLIMHILITVCPKELIVHQKENAKEAQFLKTLEVVFDNNLKYCTGCAYCKSTSQEELKNK